ncbi:MAG: M16 family metallopeptidase [Acidobacteriota bacterium]
MSQIPSIHFVRDQLENGLDVILCPDRRVPLVFLAVYYRVGSSYEKPGRSGFAHLFEHMMFQGSENVAKNEHGRYVDSAGGRWNATTSKDRTNYFETLPSHYLDLGLWLEADRMRSLRVTEENFENQRQTVIEEKKQTYDNRPYGSAYLLFDQLAYQNWAYGHSIIGSVEDLRKATLQDAIVFHRTYYRPDNATLVLAGDIDEGAALKKIETFFGSSSRPNPPPPPDLTEPEQKEEKRQCIQDPLAALAAVSVGYHLPHLGSPDHYALAMLSLVLAHGDSSRLYRKLVYDNNWVTSLSAGTNLYKGPQLFRLWLQIQEGVEVQQVLGTLNEQLLRFQEELVSEKELEKARNQVLFRYVTGRSTVADIGQALARYAVLYEDPDMINQEARRYLAVSREAIRDAAARTFRPENRTAIVVEPVKKP